jgi:hypothetical protein
MMASRVLLVVVAGWLGCCSLGVAQEGGQWRASNQTAKQITGDIAFSDVKLYINFTGFTLAQIRDLKADEVSILFDGTDGTMGHGSLFRLDIPAAKTFNHKSKICGSENAEWMASFVSGKKLQIAFFSGTAMPVLTGEAMANATDLCGTFEYVR